MDNYALRKSLERIEAALNSLADAVGDLWMNRRITQNEKEFRFEKIQRIRAEIKKIKGS